MNPGLVIVSGPTCCGKSNLAVKLAPELNAEIVNIDSVQFYSECPIGSALIPVSERCGVPHHLFEIYSPNHSINAFDIVSLIRAKVSEVISKGKQVILVGGSTLYVQRFLMGFSSGSSADLEFRRLAEAKSTEELYQEMLGLAGDKVTIPHAADRMRIIRKIEQLNEASKNLKENLVSLEPWVGKVLILVPVWKRQELYHRINQRSEIMLREGLLEEVGEIINRYGTEIPLLKSIGFNQVKEFYSGKILEEQLKESIAKATRNYSKRQLNFWRNEPVKSGWDVSGLSLSRIEASTKQLDFIGSKLSWNDLLFRINGSLDESLDRLKVELVYPEASCLLS